MHVQIKRLDDGRRKRFAGQSRRSETHEIHSAGSDIRSESFVQPEVGPPFHGDEVTEPLVGQLMGDDFGYSVYVVDCGHGRIDQQRSLSTYIIHIYYKESSSISSPSSRISRVGSVLVFHVSLFITPQTSISPLMRSLTIFFSLSRLCLDFLRIPS